MDNAATQQLEDNNKGENKNHETISVNTNKDSCTKTERYTQHPRRVEALFLNLSETQIEESLCVEQEVNSQVVTVEEEGLENPTEPMEVEATETSTTDDAAAARGEDDTSTDRNVRRMTRALKNAVLQQQMINVDKALQILDQETPPLVVDRDKLKELLERVVTKTDGYEVYKLEKLYALLCQSIYRHRRDYNKAVLIQELEQEIEDFC